MIRELVNADAMQFSFLPGRGKTDGWFVVKRMQKECRDNDKKLYMCFVGIEKAFDKVLGKEIE